MYSLSESWKASGRTLEGFCKCIRGLSQITFAERIPTQCELNLAWVGDQGRNFRVYVMGKEYISKRSSAESFREIQDEVTDAVVYEHMFYYCTKPAMTDIGRLSGIGGTRFYQPCAERTRYLSAKLCDVPSKGNEIVLVYRQKGPTKLLLGIRGKSFVLHNMQAAAQAAAYVCEKEGFTPYEWTAENVEGVMFTATKDRIYVRITDTMSGNASFTVEAGIMLAPGVFAPVSQRTVEHRGVREDAPITASKLAIEETVRFAEKALELEAMGISSMEEQKALLDKIWNAEGAEGRRDGVIGFIKKSCDAEAKGCIPLMNNRLELLEAVYTLPQLLDEEWMNASPDARPKTQKSVEALLGA